MFTSLSVVCPHLIWCLLLGLFWWHNCDACKLYEKVSGDTRPDGRMSPKCERTRQNTLGTIECVYAMEIWSNADFVCWINANEWRNLRVDARLPRAWTRPYLSVKIECDRKTQSGTRHITLYRTQYLLVNDISLPTNLLDNIDVNGAGICMKTLSRNWLVLLYIFNMNIFHAIKLFRPNRLKASEYTNSAWPKCSSPNTKPFFYKLHTTLYPFITDILHVQEISHLLRKRRER